MELLVIMGLHPRLVDAQVTPLTKINEISGISIIRDDVGPDLLKVKYYPSPELIKNILYANVFYRLVQAIKSINKIKPDVIVSFYYIPYGLTALFCAKMVNKPVCISLLGTDLNIHCKNKFYGKILINILKKANIITVPGSISRNYLIEKGIDRNKIFILPNTIDMKKFHPLKVPKKYQVIHIGALARVKHLEILFKIVKKLKKNNLKIKIGLAGPGPLRAQLEELSIQMGLKYNIEFLGFVDDATAFINSGKIYVLTSESEGLPTAMIEAMACGLPSVVSNVGNIPDVAVNGKNCFVINDYRDVNGYVNAISKLLKDDRLYRKISKNALEVKNKYSVSNATKVWKKIFTKLQLS